MPDAQGGLVAPESVKLILTYIGMNRVNTLKTVETGGQPTGKKASFSELAVGAAVALAAGGITNGAVRAEIGSGLSSMGTGIANVAGVVGDGVNAAYTAATDLFKVPVEVATGVNQCTAENLDAIDAYNAATPPPGVPLTTQFTEAISSAQTKINGYWADAVSKYDQFTNWLSGTQIPGTGGYTVSDAANYANTYNTKIETQLYIDGQPQYQLGRDGEYLLDNAGQKIPTVQTVLNSYKFTDMVKPLLDLSVIRSYQQELALHKQLAKQQSTTQAELDAQTAALKAQEAKVDAAATALHAQVDDAKSTYAAAQAQDTAVTAIGQASVSLQQVPPEYYDVVASTMKPDTLAAAKMLNTQDALNTTTAPTIETPKDPTKTA
jgi:hypothetical protein